MRKVPVAMEEAALAHGLVYINGGQRGLQVRLAPRDAVAALDATTASLITQDRDAG